LTPLPRMELFTIQFGNLEPVVVPPVVQTPPLEIKPSIDILEDDEEGWTLVTWRRPKNQKWNQQLPVHCRKRQGRKKKLQHIRDRKSSKANKKQDIQPIDLLGQKPLIPVTLEEFFTVEFFDKVTINMISYTKLEDKEDGEEEKQEDSLKRDDKTLTVLEAFQAHMGWRQIFHLSKEMHHCVAIALHYPEFYADKAKNVGESWKSLARYAICNTTITFTDDGLLLGSKPHNHPLLETGYIREQKSQAHLGRWSFGC